MKSSWMVVLGALTWPGAMQAQDLVFSLSDDAVHPTRSFADQEIEWFDPVAATVQPWLCSSAGAFFQGDVSGDGVFDDWNDVDALWVGESNSIDAVYLSLLADQGGLKDGDVFRLTRTGSVETVVDENTFITLFGCTDNNVDIDALHVGSDGTWWLSFAEDENSTVLSSDSAGVIADGAILTWNTLTGEVQVFRSEQEMNALVSQIIGRSVQVLDVLSLAVDTQQNLCFTVQAPSDIDGAVFTLANGGQILAGEKGFQFTGEIEIDALTVTTTDVPVATSLGPRVVTAGLAFSAELFGPPGHPFALLLSGAKATGTENGWGGFLGWLINPVDPLFQYSLATGAGLWWGVLDSTGRATIQAPAVPVGISVDLFCQPYDFTTGQLGTPGVVHIRG